MEANNSADVREIVFYVPGLGTGPYTSICVSHIEPILRHLTNARISETYVEGALNVSLFTSVDAEVFMSHGLADKAWRDRHSVSKYQHVFVSGPAWYTKYIKQGIASRKIYIVGYPALDAVIDIDGEPIYEADDSLVWAPTHINSGSSVARVEPFLEIAPELGFSRVDKCLHPFHIKGAKVSTTAEAIARSSVVVADFGSTVYEAWACDRPVVFPDWLMLEDIKSLPGFFEQKIYREGIGRHAHSEKEFYNMLVDAYENGITQEEIDFADTIFPSYLRGRSGKLAAEVLRSLL